MFLEGTVFFSLKAELWDSGRMHRVWQILIQEITFLWISYMQNDLSVAPTWPNFNFVLLLLFTLWSYVKEIL